MERYFDESPTATAPLSLDPITLATTLAQERPDTSDRPWVATNMVATLDGAATLDGRSGGIGGPGDRAVFTAIRALADVIVVGAGTVRTERYRAAVPSPEVQEWRVAHGRRAIPTVAVVTASGRLGDVPLLQPDPALAVEPPTPLVYCGSDTPEAALADLRRTAEVVQGASPRVAAAEVVADLAERGHRHILCEGGPALLAQFHDADLLDDWFVTVGPLVSAGPAPRLMSARVEQVRALDLVHVWGHEGVLFLRHRRPLTGRAPRG